MRTEDVLARIDPKEVVDLALALGNIDSPTGSEGPAGDFVFQWLAGNGFVPKVFLGCGLAARTSLILS